MTFNFNLQYFYLFQINVLFYRICFMENIDSFLVNNPGAKPTFCAVFFICLFYYKLSVLFFVLLNGAVVTKRITVREMG